MEAKQCKICGRKAVYAYYSVVACDACKIFFRRNAPKGLESLECSWDQNCEINENNVHVCSYCRLKKCLAVGMQPKMIRGHVKRRMKTTNDSPPEQLPTLNLLRSDTSTLTIDQWNKISNLSNCFDEYNGLLAGERFAREQNALPPKLRLKNTSLIDFTGTVLNGLQLLYVKNQDFVSLSTNDRSVLLANTVKHTGCICTNFILYKAGITDYPTYYDAVTKISNSFAAAVAKRLPAQFDFDVIIEKLLLAVLSFSTINYTTYSNVPRKNLSDIKQVLQIQNTYIELIWRYLLYKYDFKQSVNFFSRLVQCLFTANEVIVKVEEVQWYTEQTDCLFQQTEQALNLND